MHQVTRLRRKVVHVKNQGAMGCGGWRRGGDALVLVSITAGGHWVTYRKTCLASITLNALLNMKIEFT